jgi:hypothetical protein
MEIILNFELERSDLTSGLKAVVEKTTAFSYDSG